MANTIEPMKKTLRVEELITNYIESNIDDVIEASGEEDRAYELEADLRAEIERRRKNHAFVQGLIDTAEGRMTEKEFIATF